MRAIVDENFLDKLLDQHRSLWESGQRPLIYALVQELPESIRDDATLDLIYNEIVLRESIGETPTLEEYRLAYPQYEAELVAQFEVHKAISDGLLIDTQTNSITDSQALPAIDPKPDVTESIPGYELLREIGRGGFAIVYQAKNKQLRRDVAIKMFQPGRIPSGKELGRFRSEATAVARLNHPNIVQVFEIGQWAGVPFLVLEFVEGGTLARKLERALLPAQQAAALIEKLALAIQHAHERGVIHRDLKPANILFDSKGEPKIADFGLAKLLESENNSWEATRTGEPLGTPRYMAPEQASGNSAKIGKCTDIYALGVLLYECLTGQAPFVAASVVESLKKITQDEPTSPRKLQPTVPRDLATICLKCLEKQPIRRYGSAVELAEDLNRFQNGQSIQARPTPVLEVLWKKIRRRPAEALLATTLVLALGGMLTWFSYGSAIERSRIAAMRTEVGRLAKQGRDAAEDGLYDQAVQHMTDAWRIVHAEPALADLSLGVEGWLDHCQRAASVEIWSGRVPPRDFDQLRDDAVVDSLLLEPISTDGYSLAREAIQQARELTEGDGTIDELAWRPQRELLDLLECGLVADCESAEKAREFLQSRHHNNSRTYWETLATLLDNNSLKDQQEALDKAHQFPPDTAKKAWLKAISALRQSRYDEAEKQLQQIISQEPANFSARLLQGIGYSRVGRFAEAKIALTACIAQRPTSGWSYYWRAVAQVGLNDQESATLDIQRANKLKRSASLQFKLEEFSSNVESKDVSNGRQSSSNQPKGLHAN